MSKIIFGAPVESLGECLAYSSKPTPPESIFGPEMKNWIASMQKHYGPDYMRFGMWRTLIMTTKDNLLDCIDFISECIALDGIGKIDALERGELTTLE